MDGTEGTYQGRDVIIVRAAQDGDPGYNPAVEQVIVFLPDAGMFDSDNQPVGTWKTVLRNKVTQSLGST